MCNGECLVLLEATRGYQILENWSYRQLVVSFQVDARIQTWVLCVQWVFLTTESSFQSQFINRHVLSLPSKAAGCWGQDPVPVEYRILCYTTLEFLALRFSPQSSHFLVAPFNSESPSLCSHSCIATHPVAVFWFFLRRQSQKLTMLSMSTEPIGKQGRSLKDTRDCLSIEGTDIPQSSQQQRVLDPVSGKARTESDLQGFATSLSVMFFIPNKHGTSTYSCLDSNSGKNSFCASEAAHYKHRF